MSLKGIKAWLKKKGIEPDTVDVEAEYDSGLSYSENLKHFKQLVKTGKGSRTGKEYDAQWCQELDEQCRKNKIKEACKAKKRDCSSDKKKSVKAKKPKAPKVKTPIRDMRKAKRRKACKRVKVKKHTRRCPTTGRFL